MPMPMRQKYSFQNQSIIKIKLFQKVRVISESQNAIAHKDCYVNEQSVIVARGFGPQVLNLKYPQIYRR